MASADVDTAYRICYRRHSTALHRRPTHYDLAFDSSDMYTDVHSSFEGKLFNL